MRVAKLEIQNYRGIRKGEISFGKHPVLIGSNNTGKTTVIEALTLLFGRDRLIRDLSEHDFYGSNPLPADRIKLIATITDFVRNDPDRNTDWFRDSRAVLKWMDPITGTVHSAPDRPARVGADSGGMYLPNCTHRCRFGPSIQSNRRAIQLPKSKPRAFRNTWAT